MIEHYWRELPGPVWFCGATIYANQVQRAKDGAVFVELGAWKGRSASFMGVEIARSGKKIDFYSIDHFRGSEGEIAHAKDEDLRKGQLYQAFLENTVPVRQYINVIQSESSAAAAQFPDQSVDFIFIDAEHTHDGVIRDLRSWWPKIKPGGTVAGDDWVFFDKVAQEFGVRRAVDEFASEFGLSIELIEGDPYPGWTQWSIAKPG